MHILSNGWVIGIGSGVASGLLVTWMLRLFISKKKSKEYLQQISSANREIVYSIRTAIPDNALPKLEVVEAMIHSTARRYGVEATELYLPNEIAEELIKEVMDSSFLPSAKKIEYCTSLIHLADRDLGPSPDIDNDRAKELIVIRKEALQSQRTKTTELEGIFSLLAGLFAALATGFFTIQQYLPHLIDKVKSFSWTVSVTLLVPAVVAATAALLGSLKWKRTRETSLGEDLSSKANKE